MPLAQREKEVIELGKGGLIELLGVIFAGAAVAVALAELFAKRCPECGQKLVVIDNRLYCNHCNVYYKAQ